MKVLITGATGGFGKLLMERLEAEPAVERIIGLSNKDVDEGLEDYLEDDKHEFYIGDVRKKRVEEIFQRNRGIDCVVHLAYDNVPEHSGRDVEETNVFGTLRMIQLARKYSVEKFIFKSPTAVYGANPDNPALIREDYPLRGDRQYEAIRNKIESDMTCQMNMHPGILPKVVILRFCGIIGSHVRSPLNTIFRTAYVPMVSGFDPMFQVIHEGDVTEALALAVLNQDSEGIYNVAGKHTAPISEVIHRMDKTALPLPERLLELTYKSYFMLQRRHSFPFNLDFLKYSFAVDDSRIRRHLGYEPRII